MGGTGAAGNGGGGGGGGGGTGGAGPQFSTFIPETYRDKDWVKQNATTPDNFFKFVDNLNTTVGKKGVLVPGENASKDEISAFRKGIGVPDSETEYEFANIPEAKDTKRDPDVEKSVKKIFHEAGIPKETAKKLQMGYEKMMYDIYQKETAKNKEMDAAFDKEIAKIFGDKKDTVLASARKLLKEHVPAEIGLKLDQLDNNSLVIMTAALDGIIKKYVKEDGFQGGGAGAAGSGSETFEALSAQQRELMKSPAFKDFRHADHQKTMDQNNALMEKMRAIKK